MICKECWANRLEKGGVVLCPLHEAAAELLEAAKIMHAMLTERGYGGLAGTMLGAIAIRKAETKR